jgi:hypothetical protein
MTIPVTRPGTGPDAADPGCSSLNEGQPMSASQNKQNAQNAYAAFGNKDAEGAMRDIDDAIAWTEGGDNALTGTHNGKQASASCGGS